MANESVGVDIVENGDGLNALQVSARKLADNMDAIQASSNKTTAATKSLGDTSDKAAQSVSGLGDAIGRVGSTASGFNAIGASATEASAGLDKMRAAAAANTDYQRDLTARSKELAAQMASTSSATAAASSSVVSNGKASAETLAIMERLGARFKDTSAGAADASRSVGTMADVVSMLGGRFNVLRGIVTSVIGAFSALLSVLSVEKFIQLADAYTMISNQLKPLVKDQAALDAALDKTFEVANRTRTAWDATASIYGKVSNALKGLNQDQSKATGITETINQAINLTGASADQAKRGLFQLTQAFDKGTLQGQDFKSILDQIPGLANAIAAGMNNGAGVTIGKLRDMATQGQITSKVIIQALQNAGPKVAAMFAQTTPTVTQAIQVWNNNLMNFAGQVDEATGFTSKLASVIMFLGNNVQIVVPVVAAFAAALALRALPSIIAGVTALGGALMGVLLPAITANIAALGAFLLPIAAIGAAFAAIVVGATALYTAISMLAGYFTNVSSVITATYGAVTQFFSTLGTGFTNLVSQSVILQTLADLVTGFWTGVKGVVAETVNWVSTNQTLNAVLGTASKFVQNLWDNLTKLWDIAKKFVPGLADVETGLKKNFEAFNNNTGAANDNRKALAAAGAAARDAGADYNQFGEKLSDTASRLRDAEKATSDYESKMTALNAAMGQNGQYIDHVWYPAIDRATSKNGEFAGSFGTVASEALRAAQAVGSAAAAVDEYGNHLDSAGRFISDFDEVAAHNRASMSSSGGGGGGGGNYSDGGGSSGGGYDPYGINGQSSINFGGSLDGEKLGEFTTFIPGPSFTYGGVPVVDYTKSNQLLISPETALQEQQRVEDAKFYIGKLASLYPDLPPSAIANMYKFGGGLSDIQKAGGANADKGIGGSQGWGDDPGYSQGIDNANAYASSLLNKGAGGGMGLAGATGGGSSFTGGSTTTAPTAPTAPTVTAPSPADTSSSTYGGNRPIQIIINTPDYNSFRQSQKQIARDGLRELVRKAG